MRSMIRILFLLAAFGLIAGLVFGFFGFAHPAFDTFAHFRWHFALGLLALAIFGLLLRIRRAPFILLIFAALGVWQSGANNRIESCSGPDRGSAAEAVGTPFRLLQFNLRFDNPRREEVIDFILETDADILMLNETSRLWEDALEKLNERYPQRFHCPEWGIIGGSMIFSKLPMRGGKDYCGPYAAMGFTEVAIGGEWVELGVVHLRWPWPASGPEQIEENRPRLESLGRDAIIAGDFNAATWSHSVAQIASHGGLNIQRGFGGTWMYKWFPGSLAPLLGLPIDNILAKGRFTVHSVETLPAIGSDHLPILSHVIFTGAGS